MHHEVLVGDGRLTELKVWDPWFREVGKTRKAFSKAMGFDPMSNEMASMGVLVSAATKAGMLALTEYVCRKRSARDGRQFRHGRADLWVYHPGNDRSWAFEAKQIRCRPGTRLATLQAKLAAACRDAADIPHWEAPRSATYIQRTPRRHVQYADDAVAHHRVDVAAATSTSPRHAIVQ